MTDDITERGQKIAAKITKNLAAVFEGKKFEIISEVHLAEDERFMTPLGNKGRHGFILQEVGTDHRIVVGLGILERAAMEFQAVELPAPPARRQRRTKAEMELVRRGGETVQHEVTERSEISPHGLDENGRALERAENEGLALEDG